MQIDNHLTSEQFCNDPRTTVEPINNELDSSAKCGRCTISSLLLVNMPFKTSKKFYDTEADFGSYDSTPLWPEKRIFSIFIFVPGIFPHLAASFH